MTDNKRAELINDLSELFDFEYHNNRIKRVSDDDFRAIANVVIDWHNRHKKEIQRTELILMLEAIETMKLPNGFVDIKDIRRFVWGMIEGLKQ